MDTKRSDGVVGAYKQHKLNKSVITGIRVLLAQFDAENAINRQLAWLGVVIAVGLVAITVFFLNSGSQITIG